MSDARPIISYLDKMLIMAGIAGAMLYALLLPTVHPDAAPNVSLNREDIIRQALDFTRLRGYNASSMTWQAYLRRQPDLLDTLGKKLGAAPLFNGIQDGSLDDLPLYYWPRCRPARKSIVGGNGRPVHHRLHYRRYTLVI